MVLREWGRAPALERDRSMECGTIHGGAGNGCYEKSGGYAQKGIEFD